MRLVHHCLLDAAQRFSEKPAIISDQRELTYAELVGRINGLSARLADAGLKKGERVLILLADKVDFIVASYAVIARGGIAVPVPGGTLFPTLEQIARDCSPFIIITSSKDLAKYPFLPDRVRCSFLFLETSGKKVQTLRSSRNFFSEKDATYTGKDFQEAKNIREDDGALILPTSTTAAERKNVLLSHRNLIQATQDINEFMRIDSNIREFVGIPLGGPSGLRRTCCVLFVGGTVVVNYGMLNPLAVVQGVLEHHCDAISSVPSGLSFFFGRLEPSLREIGPQIRFIELGGSSMPLDHKIKLLGIFSNARICMHYGLREAPCITMIEFRNEQRKLHTVGRPPRNVAILICRDSGETLGQMQLGEVRVRGDHVAVGYWKNDELSTQSYMEGRWFKTGDYGFIDEEGYLHLLGRKDEIINVAGAQISILEVEEKIREMYPGEEFFVIGVPDPADVVGQIPVLCYNAKDGKTITPSDLSRALSGHLDENKIPRVVYRIDHLPKTHDIKVMRRELRQKIVAGIVHEVDQTD
jgi:long-chain acyl-CoA synthetase